ncbi:MAG TPA: tetratricopeptide repeat protein [Candidatus Bathyarchaeia archaeon]|nr:tetratricopeptide repeat protein [Candidatus Bathyarchaeia archaeon]
MAITPQTSTGKGRKLDSWKAIADYMDRDVRSVQRWEHDRGLPVHRVPGAKGGGVFAYADELDEWLHQGRSHPGESDPPSANISSADDLGSTGPSDDANVLIGDAGTSHSAGPLAGRQRTLVALIGVALLAVVSLLARQFLRPPVKPASGRVMLAVLPFLNLSGDPRQEYFADGLTEEMITDLGRLNPQALGVIARTSAMKYKGSKQDVGEIGRALGVRYVLEGSVRREGDLIRVSAQLIQVSDQTHLWAQNYQRDVKDILKVQRDVAQAIAGKIQIELSPQKQPDLAESPPASPQAYDDYLKGLYLWNERTVDSMSKAATFFEQAAAEDANYAAAYAGMARCYALLSMEGLPNDRELLAKAKASAMRAVELDDGSAEAHVALGGVKVFSDFDWPGAEAEFKRAIELNPNDALAHHWYANLYLDPQGRYDEAIAEMKRAQELDPLSLIINTDLGYAYYVAGEDEDASNQFHKVLEMDSSFAPALYDLAILGLRKKMSSGSPADRAAELRTAGPPQILHKLGEEQNRGGSQVAAGKGDDAKSAWELAQAYAYLGEKEQAISFLEASYRLHNPAIIYIKSDPYWSALRSERRFQELEQRLGLL